MRRPVLVACGGAALWFALVLLALSLSSCGPSTYEEGKRPKPTPTNPSDAPQPRPKPKPVTVGVPREEASR